MSLLADRSYSNLQNERQKRKVVQLAQGKDSSAALRQLFP